MVTDLTVYNNYMKLIDIENIKDNTFQSIILLGDGDTLNLHSFATFELPNVLAGFHAKLIYPISEGNLVQVQVIVEDINTTVRYDSSNKNKKLEMIIAILNILDSYKENEITDNNLQEAQEELNTSLEEVMNVENSNLFTLLLNTKHVSLFNLHMKDLIIMLNNNKILTDLSLYNISDECLISLEQ